MRSNEAGVSVPDRLIVAVLYRLIQLLAVLTLYRQTLKPSFDRKTWRWRTYRSRPFISWSSHVAHRHWWPYCVSSTWHGYGFKQPTYFRHIWRHSFGDILPETCSARLHSPRIRLPWILLQLGTLFIYHSKNHRSSQRSSRIMISTFSTSAKNLLSSWCLHYTSLCFVNSQALEIPCCTSWGQCTVWVSSWYFFSDINFDAISFATHGLI
jgi:hypothetical protein